MSCPLFGGSLSPSESLFTLPQYMLGTLSNTCLVPFLLLASDNAAMPLWTNRASSMQCNAMQCSARRCALLGELRAVL